MCVLNKEYQVKRRVNNNIYRETMNQSQNVHIKVFIFSATLMTGIIFHVQCKLCCV